MLSDKSHASNYIYRDKRRINQFRNDWYLAFQVQLSSRTTFSYKVYHINLHIESYSKVVFLQPKKTEYVQSNIYIRCKVILAERKVILPLYLHYVLWLASEIPDFLSSIILKFIFSADVMLSFLE
jgi:hypothetical protein